MGWTNAHVNVENAKLGLGWAVTDDKTGDPTNYATLITVTLPDGTNASVSKKAPNETVVLSHSASLPRGPDGIEANVAYRVSPLKGANGQHVEVKVATVAGQKPAATADILAEGTGQVGQTISVHIVIA
jgi:hypothetical protein